MNIFHKKSPKNELREGIFKTIDKGLVSRYRENSYRVFEKEMAILFSYYLIG